MKKKISSKIKILLRLSMLTLIFICTTAATTVTNNDNEQSISAGKFKTYKGLTTFFSNDFDFDFPCGIQKYELMYQGQRMDPVQLVNKGARFNERIAGLVKRAKPGDVFIFMNIQAKCEGDLVNRKLSSIIVKIK